MNSPWGKIQHVTVLNESIAACSTAGHGGIKVYRSLNKLIPKPLRSPWGVETNRYTTGWYEEDCECTIPLYFLFDHLPVAYQERLKKPELLASIWRYFKKEAEQVGLIRPEPTKPTDR